MNDLGRRARMVTAETAPFGAPAWTDRRRPEPKRDRNGTGERPLFSASVARQQHGFPREVRLPIQAAAPRSGTFGGKSVTGRTPAGAIGNAIVAENRSPPGLARPSVDRG